MSKTNQMVWDEVVSLSLPSLLREFGPVAAAEKACQIADKIVERRASRIKEERNKQEAAHQAQG